MDSLFSSSLQTGVKYNAKNNQINYINFGSKNQTTFKVIFLGDVGVGKTSLYRSLSNESIDDVKSTVSLDTKLIHSSEGDVCLNVYDTVGQEAFKSIYQNYYRKPQIVILVFDISRMATFINIQQWYQYVLEINPGTPIRFYLVANKTDLAPDKDLASVWQYAENNDMLFYPTSIKTPDTIQKLKDDLMMYANQHQELGQKGVTTNVNLTPAQSKSLCC